VASGRGLLHAKAHVKAGGVLILFPSGEVSSFGWRRFQLKEPVWSQTMEKFLLSLNAPIHPVDIHASLSPFFYVVGSLGPKTRTALLPGEAVRKRFFSPVDIRIGQGQRMVEGAENSLHFTLETRRKQLRKLPPKDKYPRFFVQRPRKQVPLAEPVAVDAVTAEIKELVRAGKSLTSHGPYLVLIAEAHQIPKSLLEIGRLREVTFRAIGEGSGKARDLDRFDQTYRHLLLWNTATNALQGAYRLGFGPELYREGGIRAFYLREFFKMHGRAKSFMAESLEMGRAFIVPEAQQKPFPLFLLWKGIIHVLLRHPELRYVIGSVSISNSYSKHSQAVMLAFIKHHFWDAQWYAEFRPKKAFKLRLRGEDKRFVASSKPEDLMHIDRMIGDLEPAGMRMPVLIKKYIGQNAKVLGFNRDPEFNTVDALMYMDINEMPEKTLAPVLEELAEGLGLPGVEGIDQP
jgi:putative hemolysin